MLHVFTQVQADLQTRDSSPDRSDTRRAVIGLFERFVESEDDVKLKAAAIY